MKTAIVYYSYHHGNTKKLLDAIAGACEVTLIDAAQPSTVDLQEYDLIGFASGIYAGKFHKSVLRFAEKSLPRMKKVFFIYTYGAKREGYTTAITKAVNLKGADIRGEYGCAGFNTFGPFKLIGGTCKGHPDQKDLDGAVEFYKSLAGQV